ncbi:sulfotransferase [Alloyangia pacifica]|uniref:sulfotransferase n=1 Tax=Alloyangia pacifica TaxID=311180 RepID=UPI001CFD43B0|nr:sulfotransferase [Alloyangia pacifica]
MIATFVVSLLAVAGFGVGLWRSNVVPVARSAVRTAMVGITAMMDSELGDDAKEVAVRRAGFSLIGAAFGLLWRFALALVLAAVPILGADLIGLVPAEAVLSLMLRLDYIFIVSVAAIAGAELLRRLRGSARHDPAALPEINRYSTTDRFFHMLAFSSPAVLRGASRLEDRLMPGAVQEPSGPPIFVTSLARGGTTALLNALHEVPGIATHTYRDMPFLTAPALWNRLAGGRSRDVGRHERAHGDGLQIDLDSPEAFEEVLWKTLWPGKYGRAGIALWQAEDRDPAAEAFIARQMRKVIHARSPGHPARYCSKNNANLARIPYLREAFPGCHIVVPLRRPETHAASLLRQHLNFLKLQQDDEFIRRYMRDIGHFEFGQILKPQLFPGFDPAVHDATTPDYWINYWLHAFRHVQRFRDRCIFVLQDDMRAAPQDTLEALCEELGVAPGKIDFGAHFRPSPDRAPRDLYDPELFAEADALYRNLAPQDALPDSLTPVGGKVITARA